MVRYHCDCGLMLDYYHDVEALTEEEETEREKGLLFKRTVTETDTVVTGYECAYCGAPLDDGVGASIEVQYRELGSIVSKLGAANSKLDRVASHLHD